MRASRRRRWRAAWTDWRSPSGLPQAYFARGSYFALQGRAPFRRLIYPLPGADGLGIHLTLDLAGQARFGPDVEWVEKPDYQVNPQRAAQLHQRDPRLLALPGGRRL